MRTKTAYSDDKTKTMTEKFKKVCITVYFVFKGQTY